MKKVFGKLLILVRRRKTQFTWMNNDDGATFSKLLRKILGRFLFLGKDRHFRNFLGISSWEDLPRKILGKCAFSKLLWKDFRKHLGKYVAKHQPCLTKESCKDVSRMLSWYLPSNIFLRCFPKKFRKCASFLWISPIEIFLRSLENVALAVDYRSSGTYSEVRVHVARDEVACLVDWMVERIRTDRIIVSVANIERRDTGNCHERRVITSRAEDFYSTQVSKSVELYLDDFLYDWDRGALQRWKTG